MTQLESDTSKSVQDGLANTSSDISDSALAIAEPVLDVLEATHAIATASGSEDGETSSDSGDSEDREDPPVRIHVNSRWRFDYILGQIVPLLLLAFIGGGGYLMNITLRPYIERSFTAPAQFYTYLATFDILLCLLIFLFSLIYLSPANHSAPPSAEAQATQRADRSVPQECGPIAHCWQDACNGRPMPPLTRHCRICRVCRVRFDHCCPWFGTCIARDTMKRFVLFLGSVPVTIGTGLWAVAPIANTHRKLVMDQLWDSTSLHEIWWSRWYTWLGGPFFRWGVGLILCYWKYDRSEDQALTVPPVSLTPILYTALGSILALFCIALMWVSVGGVLRGESAVDAIRQHNVKMGRRRLERRVWLPGASQEVEVPPDMKLYHLGAAVNWRDAFGEGVLQWMNPFHLPDRNNWYDACEISAVAVAELGRARGDTKLMHCSEM